MFLSDEEHIYHQRKIIEGWELRIRTRALIVERAAALWERQICYWEALKEQSPPEDCYTPEEWWKLIELRSAVAMFAARLWEKKILDAEEFARQRRIAKSVRLMQWLASYNELAQSCDRYNQALAANQALSAQMSQTTEQTGFFFSSNISNTEEEVKKPLTFGVHRSTRSRLLTLLSGDEDAAQRLIERSKHLNPEKSEQWHYEKVIDELLADRR